MVSSPRGLALIISNVNFDREIPELVSRVGGEVDEELLSRVFADLDFSVMVFRNLTAQVHPASHNTLRKERMTCSS